MKEIKSNLQNKHATAHQCWQGGGVGQGAKLSLWAEFLPFPIGSVTIWMKKICDSDEKYVTNEIDLRTHHKNIPAAAH